MDIIYTIWLLEHETVHPFTELDHREHQHAPLFPALPRVRPQFRRQIPGLGGNYVVFLIPGMVAMSVLFTSVFWESRLSGTSSSGSLRKHSSHRYRGSR